MEQLGVPRDFIHDAIDPDQVSLIEKQNGSLLALVRVPYLAGERENPPYRTVPVGIVVNDDWVTTIGMTSHELLRDLPHELQREADTTKPTRFLLVILWSVAQSYLRRLNEIDEIVEGLEDRLQRSQQNREVLELLRYQKSLVHFTNSLNGNGLILDRLGRGELLKLQRAEQRLLDDVTIEHRQAIGRVQIANDILSNMMDAFASIISNNLNTVMKLLTSLTVVLIVSTLIATFYGMNVPLPFEDERWAFPVLAGVSLLSAVVTAFIFWKKDWL